MKVTITRVDWRQRKPWMLHYRPQGIAGPQRRLFFRRRLDAETKQREILAALDSHGAGTLAALSPEQVREYQEAKALAAQADLRDIAREWAAREGQGSTSPHLRDAYAHWLASLRGNSARYLESVKVVAKIVERLGGTGLVAQTSAEQITAAIEEPGLAIQTLANRRRMVGTFFAHCLRMGWRSDDPMPRVPQWRVHRKTPDFYSVAEVREILQAVRTNEPRLLPALALRFFAGIRTQELARIVRLGLQADIQIAQRRILIRSEVAKGRKSAPRPRLIEGLPPALWQWLKLGDLEWPVHAPRLLRAATKGCARAIPNGPRHTFATYAVAHFDSVDVVARKLGNSSSVALRHYMGITTQAEAAAFFKLAPKTV